MKTVVIMVWMKMIQMDHHKNKCTKGKIMMQHIAITVAHACVAMGFMVMGAQKQGVGIMPITE